MALDPSAIPTKELLSKVAVHDTPNFGRTAFAVCNVEPGEIVIVERPLLLLQVGSNTCLYPPLPKEGDAGRRGTHEQDDDVRVVALRDAFRTLLLEAAAPASSSAELDTTLTQLFAIIANERNSAAVLAETSKDMYAPAEDKLSPKEAHMIRLLLAPPHFDACVPNWSPARPWFASATVADVARLMACCRINVHADDTRGFSGLFQRCSKFAHSCNANTFWFLHIWDGKSMAAGAVAVHVATRPIKAGEQLSFSYLGSGLNMLAATVFRRLRLRDLSFDCGCDRCFKYDCGQESCRALRCGECGERALSLVPPSGGWFCLACREVCAYSETLTASLFQENVLRTASMQLYFAAANVKSTDAPSADDARRAMRSWMAPILAEAKNNGLLVRWVLFELIEEHLGPDHYLFAMGVFSIFRCWILAIKMLLEAGKSDLEEFTMFFRPGGASQLSSGHVVGGGDGSIVVSFAQQLARWYALGQRWIAANVPGGCLSVNFTLLTEEAIGLTAASTAVVALLEPSELAVVMKLREVIAKDAAPLASLRQWKEFQPLYKRGAW